MTDIPTPPPPVKIEQKPVKKDQINIPDIDELTIYGKNFLREIKIEDLLNNEPAIIQLINDRNMKIKELREIQNENSSLISEKEYLKTSPFFMIFASIVNLIGVSFCGLGINLLSGTCPTYTWFLLICGGILVLVASCITILYPFARNWCNKKKTSVS